MRNVLRSALIPGRNESIVSVNDGLTISRTQKPSTTTTRVATAQEKERQKVLLGQLRDILNTAYIMVFALVIMLILALISFVLGSNTNRGKL